MNSNDSTAADAPTIIVCAAEDDRRAAVLSAAVSLAGRDGAGIVLYDIDASSFWHSPVPEHASERYPGPMSPSQLRHLGRTSLAEQIEEIRGHGIQAWGWLPLDGSVDSMLAYATRVGASRIMLSTQLETPTFTQRLHHLTADRARRVAGPDLDIIFVGDDVRTAD